MSPTTINSKPVVRPVPEQDDPPTVVPIAEAVVIPEGEPHLPGMDEDSFDYKDQGRNLSYFQQPHLSSTTTSQATPSSVGASSNSNDNLVRDIPSILEYKDQGRNASEFVPNSGTTAQLSTSRAFLPSHLDYKDQGINPSQLGILPPNCQTPETSRSPETSSLSGTRSALDTSGNHVPITMSSNPIGASPEPVNQHQEHRKKSCLFGTICLVLLFLAVGLVAALWWGTDINRDRTNENVAPIDTSGPTLSPSGASGSPTSSTPTVSPTLMPTPSIEAPPGTPYGHFFQLGENIDGTRVADLFGGAVALSTDGLTVASGATQGNEGQGYVRVHRFDIAMGQWQPLGQVIRGANLGDKMGTTVALSGDGSILAMGGAQNSTNPGVVRVFRFDIPSNEWLQLGQDLNGEAAGDEFGFSLAISSNGFAVAVGAPYHDGNRQKNSGQVKVFRYVQGTKRWGQRGLPLNGEAADDWFGFSVALSSDGWTVAVGAYLNDGEMAGEDSGHVRVFSYNQLGTRWEKWGQDIDGKGDAGGFGYSGDGFGYSVALSSDASTVVAGAWDGNYVGVYRYDQDVDVWKQMGKDLQAEAFLDRFGNSVAISSDGLTVAAGALMNDGNGGHNSGHIRVFGFDKEENQWRQIGQDLNGEDQNDQFGTFVALSGEELTVAGGAAGNAGGEKAGYVRVYRLNR